VAQTVDQVVIINRGRLLVQSPLGELTARLAGSIRVETAHPEALEAALRSAGAVVERVNGKLQVQGLAADRIGEIALGANVELRELVTESSTLEDVFLQLTAEPPA
jgi:ABC-2 type transport system ATP-binding protein